MSSGNPSPAFPPFPKKIPLGHPETPPAGLKVEEAFLDAVQGNILKGHGRDFLRLVFFRFTSTPARSGDFLRAAATRDNSGQRRWVTSALDQRGQRDIRVLAWRDQELLAANPAAFSFVERSLRYDRISLAGTQLFSSLLLTRAGLQFLGATLADESFRLGMKSRMGGMLAPGEMGAAPYCWENTADDFHGAFLLASDDQPALDAGVTRLAMWGRDYGVVVLPGAEAGFTWRDNSNPYGNGYLPPREPFGFADGISQPHFFADERTGQPMRANRPPAWEWTNLALENVFIPAGEHAGGSFVALLKIEQKVATFRQHEAAVAAQLAREFSLPPAMAAYLAPAVLMGRTRAGYPLGEVLGQLTKTETGLRALFPANPPAPNPGDPAARPPQPPPWLNEFDFKQQAPPPAANAMPAARGCPFHVHLRKMNPRTTESDSGTKPGFIAAQPVRRGAAYDPQGLLVRRERGETPAWPDQDTGLLFLAYMRDLASQFEMAHSHWAPDASFPEPGGPDPVLASPAPRLKFGHVTLPDMPKVLNRLGGVYLFAPSLPWLQRGGL